ncbi:MAG: DASS family sodium-coupled anion symporter [Flavobacteriaceae bacterium]|jgi:sodium-dependent dicarboxylate transporter 2/3/5|nr:DASS family sodium-coupled anion symporter [Flavobacteriaceae bacterium]
MKIEPPPQETEFSNSERLLELPEAQKCLPGGIIKGIIITIIATVTALIFWKILPYEDTVNKGLAVLVFVAILWFTEAVHITITALMIPILGVATGLPDFTAKKALSSFADPIIFLFFGGFALATALHAQKLDKKIATWIISLSGSNLGIATLGIFSVTAFLSMWVSNTATAAMMLPLALGLMSHLDIKKERNTFVFILLGIAYSASVGGMGTLVGSPPNAIAAKYLNIDFTDWIKYGLPIVIVLMPILLGAMFLILRPKLNVKVRIQTEDIPWTTTRILTLVVFIVTAFAWILGNTIEEKFGISNPDTFVALCAAIMVVFLGLSSWKQVSDNTDWGVLFLFGGGITLSVLLKDSGASLALGQQVAQTFGNDHPFLVIFMIAFFIIFWTEFTSNTASAALLVPVVASIASQMGLPEELLVLIIGIGASCAFMLPVATPPNAIVFGTGLIKQKEMVRIGIILNIISIIIISIWGYFFLM